MDNGWLDGSVPCLCKGGLQGCPVMLEEPGWTASERGKIVHFFKQINAFFKFTRAFFIMARKNRRIFSVALNQRDGEFKYSRSPTFGDFVTILTLGSMLDNMVARLQSGYVLSRYRLPSPPFIIYTVR